MVAVADRNDIHAVFGGKLRALRRAAGLTQGQLGEMIGTNDVAISRLENGSLPTWETAVKLAAALGVKLDDFTPDAAPQVSGPDLPSPRPMGKFK